MTFTGRVWDTAARFNMNVKERKKGFFHTKWLSYVVLVTVKKLFELKSLRL